MSNERNNSDLIKVLAEEFIKIHNRFDAVDKRIDLLTTELVDFKKQTHKDLTEIKKAMGRQQSDIADHELRIVELEEERKPKQ